MKYIIGSIMFLIGIILFSWGVPLAGPAGYVLVLIGGFFIGGGAAFMWDSFWKD